MSKKERVKALQALVYLRNALRMLEQRSFDRFVEVVNELKAAEQALGPPQSDWCYSTTPKVTGIGTSSLSEELRVLILIIEQLTADQPKGKESEPLSIPYALLAELLLERNIREAE